MYRYERILSTIWDWFKPKPPRNFTLETDTLRTLKRIARQENRTPEEVANQFLGDAMHDLQMQDESWRCWQKLTPREKQVAALICLGDTGRQIGAKLHISQATVKTHVEHILFKFGERSRSTLRLRLTGWDFDGWDL